MSRGFSRWIRSKAGMGTLVSVLAVLLLLVVAGQLMGWWVSLGDMITGTAGPPPSPSYPAPEGGYTCLPTCFDGQTDYDGDGTVEPQDAKFLSIPGEGTVSFTDEPVVTWVSTPGDVSSFDLSIFDGDSCKDNAGNLNCRGGNWDANLQTQVVYKLYADPLRDGKGMYLIGTWTSNDPNPTTDPNHSPALWTASSQTMPNNDWYTLTIKNIRKARGPSGHYFYRVEVMFEGPTKGVESFKLRSTGYLSTGGKGIVGLEGHPGNFNDMLIIFPQWGGYSNPGPTTYDGDWRFKFYVPAKTTTLEIWDGDFDRGTSDSKAPDEDDPETGPNDLPPGVRSQDTKPEGRGGRGMPPDNSRYPTVVRGDPVWYEVIDPDGVPFYTNKEPSGNQEWERFVISTDPEVRADQYAETIKAGFYTFRISGLDLSNEVWFRTPYEIVDEIPPTPCDATCPRTIGYWKNNVKKVLIDGRDRGVQESRDTIEGALDVVALYSRIYHEGIDVCSPVVIAGDTRLKDDEAHMILQRKGGNPGYPDCDGDNKSKDENTMLARALQQNLASWLNFGSGKVCTTTVVSLDVHGGTFEGTLWEALREAEDIILNASGPNDENLERAKDIADQINNGNLGEDATLELTQCDITDPDDKNTEPYRDKFPPEKQPPKYEDMPEAPMPEPPPAPVIECEEPIHNQYTVESPTNNPFYGIKFEFKSGTEVLGSGYDRFEFTLTQDEAASMGSIQLEAKAGQNVGMATLEGCDFTSSEPCDAVQDEEAYFAFQFVGAEDNGDGTLTLVFEVTNFTDKALSHATFGLPDGAVPSSPSDSYESKICP